MFFKRLDAAVFHVRRGPHPDEAQVPGLVVVAGDRVNSQGQRTTKPNWCALPFAHTAARCLAKQSLKPHAQRQSPMSVARPVWGSEWPERAEAVSAKDLRSTA